MKWYTAVLPAVTFCSVMTSLSSAATIQFINTLPDTNVLLANSVATTGNIQVRNTGTNTQNNRWLGVTFTTPTNGSLDQVTFFVDTAHSPTSSSNAASLGADMVISIYSLSSLTSVPSAADSAVWSETATVPSSYTNERYMTFDLNSPVTLSAGGSYAIVLSFKSPLSNRGLNLLQASSGTIGQNNIGQTILTYDTGSTYTSGLAPLNFLLQTAAVPEVSSLSLLFVAGMGLIARRSGRQ